MERYLLFDAGCSVCNQLAHAIEEAAAGKLQALSIRSPQAREWLDQVYPAGWEHQPYLVTVEGERVRAYAGTGMALRLGWLLGPRQAWRVWNLVRQYGVGWPASEEFSAERRGFLKRAAVFVAGLFFFPRLGSAGGQGRGPAGGPAQERRPYLDRVVPLLKDDPLYDALHRSSGVKAYEQVSTERFGSLLWDHAARAFYQNTEAQALLIPIDPGQESSDIRTLLTPYSERTGLTETLVFEISPAGGASARSFSGRISYYMPDGRLISSATFENGDLISTSGSPDTISITGYWECISDCIGCVWDETPEWLKVICEGVCFGCMAAPYPALCGACVACLGAYATVCAVVCVGRDDFPC